MPRYGPELVEGPDGRYHPAPTSPGQFPVEPIALGTASPSRLANASLVLGILWGGGFFSVLAIVFGVVALRRASQGDDPGRTRAIIGLVLGVVGLGLAIAATIKAALI